MDGGSASDSGDGSAEEEHVASAAAGGVRSEVDTSSPFASVKEAVDHFGGSAEWNLQLKQLFHSEKQYCCQDVELVKVEEQTAQLKKDLAMKEREILNVLKELETTKQNTNDLTLRLHEETTKSVKISVVSDNIKVHPMFAFPEDAHLHPEELDVDGLATAHNLSTGLIIMELKQAKVNLTKSTKNYTDIQTSVELFNRKIQKEKYLLEKIREKLASNAAVVTSLLEDLNHMTQKQQKIQILENKRFEKSSCILQEIKERSYEIENSKKVTEAAKIEVYKLMSEIEQTKTSMKIAEIRIVAANRMEAAARAVESVALAEIKALTKSTSSGLDPKNSSEVIMPLKEYITLMSKAREADVTLRKKIKSVMEEVDEANQSKGELLMKVEEANAMAITWKRTLENALEKADIANRGKLMAEDALRKLRIEHGTMGFRMEYFFLVLVISFISANGRSLDVTGGRSEASAGEEYCILCQELASQVMNYFGQNKTQAQIISSLHKSCSRMLMFKTKCLSFVDRIVTVVFTEDGIFQVNQICQMVHLCGEDEVSPSDAACNICHGVAVQALAKLKHADTKLELIRVLLVGCNMGVTSGQEECMKLVMDQVPQMLTNLESFLEMTDVCGTVLSCKAAQGGMAGSASAA